VDIPGSEKEIKALSTVEIRNFKIDLIDNDAMVKFDGSHCAKLTHFILISPKWSKPGSDLNEKSKLLWREIKCQKCDLENSENCELDENHLVSYEARFKKSELQQSMLIGLVPVSKPESMIRNPGLEGSREMREYLTATGLIRIHGRNQWKPEMTEKLSSQTVSLIYGSSSSDFKVCKVKKLNAFFDEQTQLHITWEKPGIEVTHGYFIDKYALRFRYDYRLLYDTEN